MNNEDMDHARDSGDKFNEKVMETAISHSSSDVSTPLISPFNGSPAGKGQAQGEELAKEDVVKNVEGGWGWVVVFASFFCVFILDGIGYSFGVFLEPLLVDMVEGRGVLSMAGSLQVGVLGSPVLLSCRSTS